MAVKIKKIPNWLEFKKCKYKGFGPVVLPGNLHKHTEKKKNKNTQRCNTKSVLALLPRQPYHNVETLRRF